MEQDSVLIAAKKRPRGLPKKTLAYLGRARGLTQYFGLHTFGPTDLRALGIGIGKAGIATLLQIVNRECGVDTFSELRWTKRFKWSDPWRATICVGGFRQMRAEVSADDCSDVVVVVRGRLSYPTVTLRYSYADFERVVENMPVLNEDSYFDFFQVAYPEQDMFIIS